MTKVGNTSILGITMNKFFLGNYLNHTNLLPFQSLSSTFSLTFYPFFISPSLSLSLYFSHFLSLPSLVSLVSLLYFENRILFPPRRASEMEKVKMEVGSGSGSSLSQRSRRRFSCLRLCHCGLPAKIRQAWTEKNPGRHFYGCPRFKV